MTDDIDPYRMTCAAPDCEFPESHDMSGTAWRVAGEHARVAGGKHIGVRKAPVTPATYAEGTTGAEDVPDGPPAGSLVTQSQTVGDIDLNADAVDFKKTTVQRMRNLRKEIEAEVESEFPDGQSAGAASENGGEE